MVIAVLAQALALADLIENQEVPDKDPAIFNAHHRRLAMPTPRRQDAPGRPSGRRHPQANQAQLEPRCELDSPSLEDGAAKIARNLLEAARNAPSTADLSKQSLPHMLAMVRDGVMLAKNAAGVGRTANARHRSALPNTAVAIPVPPVRRPLSVVDTPAGTHVVGAHSVNLQCGLQFVTCINPAAGEPSAMHALLMQQHAGLVVDLTATGLARRASARPLKYAPPVGAQAVSADGRLQVSCISGKWLPKGAVHRKALRLTPSPGTNQQECEVTRLHAKDLGALERIKPKQLIALADAVEDNCDDPRRPIVIHADGSSDKPALLMDFLAMRRHIDARVAQQNTPCNPQMLMTALAEVLAAGAGSLDPARLTEPYLALLVQTLQQSFDPKNRRTPGKRIQIDAPPQPPSQFTAAPPPAGGDGAPQSGLYQYSTDFYMQRMDRTRKELIRDTTELDAGEEIGAGIWALLKKREGNVIADQQCSWDRFGLSKVVDFGSGTRFVTCKKPDRSDISVLHEIIAKNQVKTIVDLTAPATVLVPRWRPAYAPHTGKAATSADGAFKVDCLHAQWLKNRPTHLKHLVFADVENDTRIDVQRLHYKKWRGDEILPHHKMNLLADEVERQSAQSGRAVMLQDDGKTQNASRLMAFMAARNLIAQEMARTGRRCDNLLLMKAIGHVAVSGRAQLGPGFMATQADLFALTGALQQTFRARNAAIAPDPVRSAPFAAGRMGRMARPGREPALPRILEGHTAAMTTEASVTGPGVSRADLNHPVELPS